MHTEIRTGPLPYAIGHGLRICVPSRAQQDAVFRALSTAPNSWMVRHRFDKERPKHGGPSFLVVESDTSPSDFSDLQWASQATATPLDTTSLVFNGNGATVRSSAILHLSTEKISHPFVDMRVTELHDLGKSLQDLWGCIGRQPAMGQPRVPPRDQVPEVLRAHKILWDLDTVPPDSELRTLAIFSVIEMLIADKPDSKKGVSSLTQQLKSKLGLLSKRFSRPLRTKDFFGETKEETIWARLYDYRSRIVHGGATDFGRKLSCLKNSTLVNRFLLEAVNRLLRQCCEEPQLILGLKRRRPRRSRVRPRNCQIKLNVRLDQIKRPATTPLREPSP